MADSEDQEPTPAQDIVVTKYKMAGDMVNGAYLCTKHGYAFFKSKYWLNTLYEADLIVL